MYNYKTRNKQARVVMFPEIHFLGAIDNLICRLALGVGATCRVYIYSAIETCFYHLATIDFGLLLTLAIPYMKMYVSVFDMVV